MKIRETNHERQVRIKKGLKLLLAEEPLIKTIRVFCNSRSRCLNIGSLNGASFVVLGYGELLISRQLDDYRDTDSVKSLVIEINSTEEIFFNWIKKILLYYRENVSFDDQDFFGACLCEFLPGSSFVKDTGQIIF